MTDYKPIMTQATDFYMRASSWRKLISICFNIISYVFWRWSSVRRTSCTFELVALNWLFLVRFGFFFLNQKLNLKKKI